MIETIESPYIHAACADNFQSLVLENSKSGPVLVNFWSRKAGPCLRQYPILDKLIAHYLGRLLLVNVDSQIELKISKEYGIASVPTLKLFRNQAIIETLHGYHSEADLVKILDQYVLRDSDQQLALAIKHYSQGEHSESYQIISEAIIDDPINPRLPLALCKLLIHERRFADADNILQTLPTDIANNNDIIVLRAEFDFIVSASNISDSATITTQCRNNPVDLSHKAQLIAFNVINKHYRQALQHLVEIMDVDVSYDDNYAQKAMLKIFTILGNKHELITEFRPQLRRYSH